MNDQSSPIKHRDCTTNVDIQNLKPCTKVHIKINELNAPYNMSKLILSSY